MDITIRRIKGKDIDELLLLFKETITDAFDKEGISEDKEGLRQELEEKELRLKEDLQSNGEKRFFLIASHGNKIVGTASFGPCSKLIEECSEGRLKGVGEIGSLYILPEYQNKGIGSLLINSLLMLMLSRSIEEFCLDSGYKRAIKIWRKRFGEPSIVVKNHWGEGFDHLIWHCQLRDNPIIYKIS